MVEPPSADGAQGSLPSPSRSLCSSGPPEASSAAMHVDGEAAGTVRGQPLPAEDSTGKMDEEGEKEGDKEARASTSSERKGQEQEREQEQEGEKQELELEEAGDAAGGEPPFSWSVASGPVLLLRDVEDACCPTDEELRRSTRKTSKGRRAELVRYSRAKMHRFRGVKSVNLPLDPHGRLPPSAVRSAFPDCFGHGTSVVLAHRGSGGRKAVYACWSRDARSVLFLMEITR